MTFDELSEPGTWASDLNSLLDHPQRIVQLFLVKRIVLFGLVFSLDFRQNVAR